MAVGVYFQPQGLTLSQFDEVNRRLEQKLGESGREAPAGALHLSAFGEEGQLAVFNIWESEDAYREFSKVLLPILADVGLGDAQPMIVPIHRLDQTEAHLG